jgi:hypothetical protein
MLSHVRKLLATLVLLLASLTLLSLSNDQALAGNGDEPIGDVAVVDDAPVYRGRAVGCYYHRGRRYCSRYCYIEVNGLEYCQQRQRDAFPQGVVYDDRGPYTHPEKTRRRYK